MDIRNFVFDMDGTICESKTVITGSIRNALNKLPNVYVISGASRKQMEKQLKGLKCTILAQSGNDTDKWVNKLTDKQKVRITKHIRKIEKRYAYGGETEDRGSQISYSFVGHNANLNLKKEFDPDKKIRNHILEMLPFKDKELSIKVAGTTCLDYNYKNKGENLKRYFENTKECIYFGDNLQIGGNDHSVVGLMKTIPVTVDSILEVLENYV